MSLFVHYILTKEYIYLNYSKYSRYVKSATQNNVNQTVHFRMTHGNGENNGLYFATLG